MRSTNKHAHFITRATIRAILILMVCLGGVLLAELLVGDQSFHDSTSSQSIDDLPEFSALAFESGLIGGTGNISLLEHGDNKEKTLGDVEAVAHVFDEYEKRLLAHFNAVWMATDTLDEKITRGVFGVSAQLFKTYIGAPYVLQYQQECEDDVTLIGWVIDPKSKITSSLASHSDYLEACGWKPVASNSETTLSFVRDQSVVPPGDRDQSAYSWLLLELVSLDDRTLALYSMR